MLDDDCKVDLGRTDTYPDDVIPDADVELCLKVIRTIRGAALGPNWFCATTAVTLSHAHAAIVDAVRATQTQEQTNGK